MRRDLIYSWLRYTCASDLVTIPMMTIQTVISKKSVHSEVAASCNLLDAMLMRSMHSACIRSACSRGTAILVKCDYNGGAYDDDGDGDDDEDEDEVRTRVGRG